MIPLVIDISNTPTIEDVKMAASAEERLDLLIQIVSKLANELHTVKGGLAANTSFTKEVLEGQDAILKVMATLQPMAEAVNDMRGGIKVLGWLERPAKWIAAIGAAAAVIWSLWDHK